MLQQEDTEPRWLKLIFLKNKYILITNNYEQNN